MKSAPGRDEALVIAVPSTADALLRESQRRFRPLGLSRGQFNVLNRLAEATAGVSERERGDRLLVDRSKVPGLLGRREKAGWVRREDQPADRRSHPVGLTTAGRAVWGEATTVYLGVVGQVTAGLGAQRMDECLATLATRERNATTREPARSRK